MNQKSMDLNLTGPGIPAILLIVLAVTLAPYLASLAVLRSDERLAGASVLDGDALRREGRRMLPLWLLFRLLPFALLLFTLVRFVLALLSGTFTFWHLVFALAALSLFAATAFCGRLMLGRIRLSLLLARGGELHISVEQVVAAKTEEHGAGRSYRLEYFLYFQGRKHSDRERVYDRRIFERFYQGQSCYRFRDGAGRVLLTLDTDGLTLSDALSRLLEE